MKFVKYSSIENSYREHFVECCRLKAAEEKVNLWVAEEKVHGANFSFWSDGVTVKCGKRSGFLEITENFYNWQSVYEKYREQVLGAAKQYGPIVIYGELYGGYYDGNTDGSKRIQKEVQYCPHVDFIAFDIRIGSSFVSPLLVHDYCFKLGLPAVAPRFVGSLDDCLKLNPEFITAIPNLHDLEPLKDNWSKGFVIKPDKALYLPSGERVILKLKSPKFSESKERTYKEPEGIADIDFARAMVEKYKVHLTENRLTNVLSKIEFSKDNIGQIIRDFVKDIYSEDIQSFNNLDDNTRKFVHKIITKDAANMVLRRQP